MPKPGSLIKQAIYSDRGKVMYQYGIILKTVNRLKLEAKIYWFGSDRKFVSYRYPYIETTKLELIDVLWEP